MPYTISQLLAMSQKELDDLFEKSPAGEIPNGEAQGTAIVAPGTTYTEDTAQVINHFGWQGKNFDAATATLKNRITAFGINAIIAKIYKAPSWLDGKECIVLELFRYVAGGQAHSRRNPADRPRHVPRQGVLGQEASHRLCAAILTYCRAS